VKVTKEVRGRAALKERIDADVRTFYRSHHQICGHVIDFVDDDHATGKVYCRAESIPRPIAPNGRPRRRRYGAQGSAAGLGDGGCRQGRTADPQPGAAARQGVIRFPHRGFVLIDSLKSG